MQKIDELGFEAVRLFRNALSERKFAICLDIHVRKLLSIPIHLGNDFPAKDCLKLPVEDLAHRVLQDDWSAFARQYLPQAVECAAVWTDPATNTSLLIVRAYDLEHRTMKTAIQVAGR